MKKRIVFALLALVMLLSLVSCGQDEKQTATKEVATKEAATKEAAADKGESTQKNGAKDAADVINKSWEKYDGEKFPVGSINAQEEPVDGKAVNFDVKKVETATSLLHVSEEALGKVQEVAFMMNMMNQNQFTVASYRVKSADAEGLVSSLKESIKGTQWMCGFPDVLVIYTVNGEYVVAAFGNTQAIDGFEKGLTDAFGNNAVLKVDESLTA